MFCPYHNTYKVPISEGEKSCLRDTSHNWPEPRTNVSVAGSAVHVVGYSGGSLPSGLSACSSTMRLLSIVEENSLSAPRMA